MLRNNVVASDFNERSISIIEKVSLPNNFAQQLVEKSEKNFNHKWQINISKSNHTDIDTLEEKEDRVIAENISSFKQSNDFQEIQKIFPEAKIINYSKE